MAKHVQKGRFLLPDLFVGRNRQEPKVSSHSGIRTVSAGGADVTRKNALDLMKEIDAGVPVSVIKNRLENSKFTEDILNERDSLGYNLLQKTVIVGRDDIVAYLISIGAVIDLPGCCPPVHLACTLGHLDVLQVLLGQGVNSRRKARVCFPDRIEHGSFTVHSNSFPLADSTSRGTATTGKINADVEAKDALVHALDKDNVQVVDCLLQRFPPSDEYLCYLLHRACKGGLGGCVRYLVENPGITKVNTVGEDGLTPFHHCLRWGLELTTYLLGHSVDIHKKTDRGESCLHVLYKTCEAFTEVAILTRLLLSAGLQEGEITDLDSWGYAPLHCLLEMQTRVDALKYSTEEESSYGAVREAAPSTTQADSLLSGVADIAGTVEVLLRAGANGTRRTPGGLPCIYLTVASSRNYPDLYRILKVLLSEGVPPQDSETVDSIVLLLLRKFSFLPGPSCVLNKCDYNHYISMCEWLVRILDLLSQYGLTITQRQSPVIWQALLRGFEKITDPWLPISGDWPNTAEEMEENIFSYFVRPFMNVVVTLCRAGLDLNVPIDYTCWLVRPFEAFYMSLVVKNQLAIGVGLVCFVLKKLIQHGADPNKGTLPLELMPFRYRTGVITDRYTPLAHLLILMHDSYPQPSYYRTELLNIIRVLFSAMDHNLLHESMGVFLKPYSGSLNREFAIGADMAERLRDDHESSSSVPEDVQEVLHAYTSTISLWNSCQNRIYNALGFDLANIYKLPLPLAIKNEMYSLGDTAIGRCHDY